MSADAAAPVTADTPKLALGVLPDLEPVHVAGQADVDRLTRTARAGIANLSLQLRSAQDQLRTAEAEAAVWDLDATRAFLLSSVEQQLSTRRVEMARELDAARVDAARRVDGARATAAGLIAAASQANLDVLLDGRSLDDSRAPLRIVIDVSEHPSAQAPAFAAPVAAEVGPLVVMPASTTDTASVVAPSAPAPTIATRAPEPPDTARPLARALPETLDTAPVVRPVPVSAPSPVAAALAAAPASARVTGAVVATAAEPEARTVGPVPANEAFTVPDVDPPVEAAAAPTSDQIVSALVPALVAALAPAGAAAASATEAVEDDEPVEQPSRLRSATYLDVILPMVAVVILVVLLLAWVG